MRNFVDFTVEQINDFQTTLMRGNDTANSRYWSYEAQIWCTTKSICHQIEADCLTDDSYRLLHEDAIDWVKTQIEKVGKAVITDDDFAEEFRDMGYTTELIHKKDKDGVPYEYIIISEPEEGEEPRDEEWEIRDPEPIEICYGDPITEEDLKELDEEEDNKMWSYDECTREWCFEGKHIHAYYLDMPDENGNVDVSIFAIKNGKPIAYVEDILLSPQLADTLIESIEKNPEDYCLQSYTAYDGSEVFSLVKNNKYLETNGDWVTITDDDFKDSKVVKFSVF